MIENKLKPCCYDCDNSCIEVDTNKVSGIKFTKLFITICYSHQSVCKYYLENESENNKNE